MYCKDMYSLLGVLTDFFLVQMEDECMHITQRAVPDERMKWLGRTGFTVDITVVI